MALEFSRRKFLASAGACLGGAVLQDYSYGGVLRMLQASPAPDAGATKLQVARRTIDVNGKPGTVMSILQPNGTQGMEIVVNQPFRVVLENKMASPTAIHWHGLHPPNNDDGVPGVTQPVVRPDASAFYDFPTVPSGTHWMHSHQGLQEAYLMSAPLIVHETSDAKNDEQQIVIFLGDYSFTPPKEIYARLRAIGKPGASAPSAKMAMNKPDANDVNYDAYLANDHTLLDPQVIRVEKSGRLRLRIINGSSGTNYFVDLGKLKGELIATDGMPVRPIRGSRFPLAISQRIDVRVQVPPGGGALPILGLREASAEQTGVILATPGATVAKLPVKSSAPTSLLTLDQEAMMRATDPLAPKKIDQTSVLRLQGNMMKYDWLINGVAFNVQDPGAEKAQVMIKPGQRVALKFVNETPMSHPMHLHGHSFQVIEINGRALNGAMRDTILVPGKNTVTVAFDANNPGLWFVHCHVLWHLEAGMAALVQYQA